MTIDQAYDILGVSPDATESELKKSYRKLCLEHHPDRNQDDIESATHIMQDINEAYQILSQHLNYEYQQTQNDYAGDNNNHNAQNNHSYKTESHQHFRKKPQTRRGCRRKGQRANWNFYMDDLFFYRYR